MFNASSRLYISLANYKSSFVMSRRDFFSIGEEYASSSRQVRRGREESEQMDRNGSDSGYLWKKVVELPFHVTVLQKLRKSRCVQSLV